MSKSRKKNGLKYKDRSEGTNKHHCINESSNGRTVEENLIELKIRTHAMIHELFGNDLPHEILTAVLDTICKPFREELKKELYDILKKYKGKEYKNKTFRGDRPRHGPMKGKLYIKKPLYNNQDEDG